MASVCHEVKRCRACRGRELVEIIDLGVHAMSGIFPKADEPEPATAPLVLVRCDSCELLQLRHSVEPGIMYTSGYGYRSGLNQTMTEHLRSIVDRIRTIVALEPGDVVLDIGCNDGTLLLNYGEDLVRVGIDPLVEKFEAMYPDDFVTHPGYFDAESYRALVGERPARVVTSIAMFYDLEDPQAFAEEVASVLADDGVWVLEQSHMPTMLERNSFDTVCHEHLEYYGLRQLVSILGAAGLRIFDVFFNDSNGGSAQVYACLEDAPFERDGERLSAALSREDAGHPSGDESLAAFRRRVLELRDETVRFVQREVDAGRSFHLYGASTKGNTLLQFYGLDHTLIEAAAERNPEKWGCRTPGTEIPIISEAESRELRPDYYFVLPWHFRDEFLRREETFLASGGRFVFPLPALEVVPGVAS